MRIDKKKAFTLFALTLLITSLLLINLNLPTGAQVTPQPIYLHGPSLTPVHMDGPPLTPIHMNSNITLTPIHVHHKDGVLQWGDPRLYEPNSTTDWEELYPNNGTQYHLSSWNDTNWDGMLSPNDQIDMTDEATGNVTYYHVDRMTVTLLLSPLPGPPPPPPNPWPGPAKPTIAIELKWPHYFPEIKYDYNLPPYLNSTWHEVWPSYSNVYQLTSWMEDPLNPTFKIDPCDVVDLTDPNTGAVTWWHVEDVATDLILRKKMVQPISTWWHELYPEYSNWYHLTSWEDTQTDPWDPRYGIFSPGDQIDMTDVAGIKTWYYVDRITITINVTNAYEPTEWMKLELKTHHFEQMYEALKHPNGSLWHEVYPRYSNVYNLTSWNPWVDDNCNFVLDPSDYIWLLNMTSGIESYYHIEDMTYDIILNKKITDPVSTDWHELYPNFSNDHHVINWEDNGDGLLSPSDQIEMENLTAPPPSPTDWYHVDRVTLTLELYNSTYDETIYIEFKGPFEWMYEVKTHPWWSLWHEVWPLYSNVYEIWDWEDNCNGVLDRCDNITLWSGPMGLTFWHVEGLSIDIILNKKITDPVSTDWHELYPTYSNWYHLDDWEDNNTDGVLSPSDQVNLTLVGGSKEEYHVENVTLTLYVEDVNDPAITMYIEFNGTFEDMYLAKTDPWFTLWHQVYPTFSLAYELTSWNDNCNGVLDHSDIIDLTDINTGAVTDWHVLDLAIDMVVKKKAVLVHDVAVIDVVSLYPWVYQGDIDPINVTVTNLGDFNEPTVDVYAFYDGNLAAPKQTTSLNIGQTKTLTFNWNTAGVPPGFYTVSANVTIPVDNVPGNNLLLGNVQEVRALPLLYWKQNFTDYAPSGVPDFNQRQDLWNATGPGMWTWCTPTAVANSLWWMDSRYETSTTPPPTINNTFPLVSPYGPWDDHDPQNVQPFIQHLAYLMDTDGQRTQHPATWHPGTLVSDAQAGIAQYLSWTGLNPLGDVNGDGKVNQTDYNIVLASNGTSAGQPGFDIVADIWPETVTGPFTADNVVNQSDLDLVTNNMGKTGMFYEKTVKTPDFNFIKDEVERSEDVILMLDFYTPGWDKITDPLKELGHSVTVAGVNSTSQPPRIAISDPDNDNAEPPPQGTSGPGRVLPAGVPHVHNATPPHTLHNNASYISHDIYNVTFIAPPPPVSNASWALQGYPTPPFSIAVVEWAVIISPLPVVEVCGVNITNVVPKFKGVPMNAGYQTWTINVSVTVHNNGTLTSNITVNLYYHNGTTWIQIGTQNITNLAPSNTTTIIINWNLASVPICKNYTVKANATSVCGASDEFIDGKVKVRRRGDVDGNSLIQSLDVKRVKMAYSGWIVEPFADVNGDCTVNALDVKIVKMIYSGWLPSPPCPP